jgi:hypothetical protein
MRDVSVNNRLVHDYHSRQNNQSPFAELHTSEFGQCQWRWLPFAYAIEPHSQVSLHFAVAARGSTFEVLHPRSDGLNVATLDKSNRRNVSGIETTVLLLFHLVLIHT